MAVNHQHLRAFHAIASAGSVSAAARRLGLAQPTLSQQLKALEDRHQVALFENRKPPLRLTRAGRDLFDLTERLFGLSDRIDDLLCEDGERGPSAVRLGSDSPIYAARLAGGLLARFPGLPIQVRIGNARETQRALTEAQVDVAIMSDPPGDNRLAYEPLFVDRLVAAVPADHPRATAGVFTLADLAACRLLLREAGSRTRVAVEQMLDCSDVTPAETLELHTRDTIREGVALGLGVGLFISSECPPDPRIAYVPLDPAARPTEMSGYVVCVAERRRTRLMRTIMEIAAELRALSPEPAGPAPEARRPALAAV